MVQCMRCERELPVEFGNTPRNACTDCGWMLRCIPLAISQRLELSDSVSRAHSRPGIFSVAEADDLGRITLTADGPAPQNEDDVNEVCERLVRVLNSMGGTWSAPVEGESDVDMHSMNDDGDRLAMQVVRAKCDGLFWKAVNSAGSATAEYGANSPADEIIQAIRKKSRKYPGAQRQDLTLVVDASRTPSHTFQQVLDAFQAQHFEECKSHGFKAVWVVGPREELVVQLDQ
jgi:hypothetical protein